eukprot:5640578-Pleurochrysis_carterae.AAC.3
MCRSTCYSTKHAPVDVSTFGTRPGRLENRKRFKKPLGKAKEVVDGLQQRFIAVHGLEDSRPPCPAERTFTARLFVATLCVVYVSGCLKSRARSLHAQACNLVVSRRSLVGDLRRYPEALYDTLQLGSLAPSDRCYVPPGQSKCDATQAKSGTRG